MDEGHLYQQIAESIRREILDGKLSSGNKLPSVREMCRRWNCTSGTVQRAYHQLFQEGLLVSHAGRGTQVTGSISSGKYQTDGKIRKANLVHRAESFLLEVLTSGYQLVEIQQALELAMDRWRGLKADVEPTLAETIRFSGSHDMVMSGIARFFFGEILQGYHLNLVFTGSLGGLLALVEGRTDLAGCHLWDAETDSYNVPFIQKVLSGKDVLIVTLAHRRQGLIMAPGNPLNICDLEDLARSGLRFANRQPGSGTRIWLDAALHRLGISGKQIQGYETECITHSEVARVVAEGQADVALGLESAARAFDLDFIFLQRERYDLVMLKDFANRLPVRAFIDWLGSQDGKEFIRKYDGYDPDESGIVRTL